MHTVTHQSIGTYNLWGEPERVHVQNMDQLPFMNVTEHKTSGYSIRNKMYRHTHNTETGSG